MNEMVGNIEKRGGAGPCHVTITEHTVIAGKWNKSNVHALALSLRDQLCDTEVRTAVTSLILKWVLFMTAAILRRELPSIITLRLSQRTHNYLPFQ